MPIPLAASRREILQQMQSAKSLLIALDFDGTLLPLQARPEDCYLDSAVVRILSDLAVQERVSLAIISGRSVEDLAQRVTEPRLTLAGNHGLEIRGPDVQFLEPTAYGLMGEIERIADELTRRLSGIGRVWVERKGLSATVHFRQVDADRIPEVKSIVRRTVESLSAAGSLVPRTGNMVLEIRPAVKWNKGAAVNWLKCRLQRGADPMTLLYIGDDETDEDVFRQCSDAVTIVVGMDKVDSAAQYCVSSPKEVQELLSQILISRLTNPG